MPFVTSRRNSSRRFNFAARLPHQFGEPFGVAAYRTPIGVAAGYKTQAPQIGHNVCPLQFIPKGSILRCRAFLIPGAHMPIAALEGFRPNRPGPYHARSASDRTEDWPFWFVESNGVNCMSGPQGAVLTVRGVAERLADEWNSTTPKT